MKTTFWTVMCVLSLAGHLAAQQIQVSAESRAILVAAGAFARQDLLKPFKRHVLVVEARGQKGNWDDVTAATLSRSIGGPVGAGQTVSCGSAPRNCVPDGNTEIVHFGQVSRMGDSAVVEVAVTRVGTASHPITIPTKEYVLTKRDEKWRVDHVRLVSNM